MTAPARKSLVLTAMIFAVAMTFIDQTIVSIAAPDIQRELGLTNTQLQWAVNSYLLALAACFALGGRLADTLGHRRMVTLGVIVFAGASALCGATPTGSAAAGWLIAWRTVQGIGGALMYPAALAIVVSTYERSERGRALAVFFGIAGGLTALGPLLGGYLTAWTWRAIFWVNVPVAIIAVVLTVIAGPVTARAPARLDVRGAVLVGSGVALSVFGFQQSEQWGWTNPGTGLCIAGGLIVLIVFAVLELHTASPLINMRMFDDRTFLVQNCVLLVAMMTFVPVFFFASEYAQISLGKTASDAGLTLLYFFIGFAVAAQVGGRMLDRVGAKRPVVLGCALAAVGFGLWAGEVTTLDLGPQVWRIILTGAGLGLMLGPANTDAVNRASDTAYGAATGITQTVRNYGSSLGLAVLGTVSVSVFEHKLNAALRGQGAPSAVAARVAHEIAHRSGGAGGSGKKVAIPHYIQVAFGQSIQVVLYAMCAVMVVAGVIALVGLRRGLPAAEPGAEPPTGAGGA